MAKRFKQKEAVSVIKLIVPNGLTVEQGALAIINTATGLLVAGSTATTLVPLGHYTETVVGDGVKTVVIELFEEKIGYWFTNDATNPVTATDIFKPVYILTSDTVRVLATGSTQLGRAYLLSGATEVFVVVN